MIAVMKRHAFEVAIVGCGIALSLLPMLGLSNVGLNALINTLIIALAGQGWNILGGFGGQFSFGHAAFFGSGAYAMALLQTSLGVNPWLAFTLSVLLAGLVGLAIGWLSFRAGLRGSYFALVTLAFAEVLRILANASPLTGGAAGTLIPLNVGWINFQFANRAVFFEMILAVVVVATILTRWLSLSRFGAYLVALRENEGAAEALGVNALDVKLRAITVSAAMTGAAGAFYAQYFLFIDASIAFGPWISVEALLAPIIGGLGTVFGPLLGAAILHSLGEIAKSFAGRLPGLDLALYGTLLIIVTAFAPNGVGGMLRSAWRKSALRGLTA